MATFEIVVTDVTRYGALYCVAGWDLGHGGMIRPEPPGANAASEPSRFWDAANAGPGKVFAVGNIVRFDALPPPPDFPFPHATEDRIVDATRSPVMLERVPLDRVAQMAAGSVSLSLGAAFGNVLVRASSGKAHVAAGHQTPSLGAVEITKQQVHFYEYTYNQARRRLRAVIREGGLGYDLSVSADAALARWLAGGLPAMQADTKASNRIHVRVGLARPFPAQACYAQVNGLYFL